MQVRQAPPGLPGEGLGLLGLAAGLEDAVADRVLRGGVVEGGRCRTVTYVLPKRETGLTANRDQTRIYWSG